MENIQVCLRLRPINEKEKQRGESNIWRLYEGVSIILGKSSMKHLPLKKSAMNNVIFNYDRCFSGSCTNDHIYSTVVDNLVESSMKGINATTFMYGQTGSGKTYTILGYDAKNGLYNKISSVKNDKKATSNDISFDLKMKQKMLAEEEIEQRSLENKSGILIQALKNLFKRTQADHGKTYFIRCSYVEIYNDQVYDLLERAENFQDTLQVCEDADKCEFYIRGVKEEIISDWEEGIEKLKRGEINRRYARTVMNHSSSRSHTIFRVNIQAVSGTWMNQHGETAPSMVTESYLNFVDLAGSEKVSSHGVDNKNGQERIREGKHINKSLFFLTQVIKLKSEGRVGHIPYRNSPLTKILRTSLGGNSRTVVILCINPTLSHLDQTLSTLRFGSSAKKIENRVTANVITRNDEEAVKIMIADYEKKMREHDREKDKFRFKEKTLLKRILELEKMQNGWMTKLKATQAKTFKSLTKGVAEDRLEDVLLSYKKHGVAHMRNAGMLFFPSEENSRYEKFCHLMRSKAFSILQTEDTFFANMDEECLRRATLNPDGRFAVEGLEEILKRFIVPEKVLEKLNKNWRGLNLEENFSFLFGKLEEVIEMCRDSYDKIEQLVNICKEEYKMSISLQKKLELIEGSSGFKAIEIDELVRLKSMYEKNVEGIKKELWQRELKSRMNDDTEFLNKLNNIIKQSEAEQNDNVDEEDLDEQQQYFEEILQKNKDEAERLILYEKLKAPSDSVMKKILFHGIDELFKGINSTNRNIHSEHWQKFLDLKQETDKKLSLNVQKIIKRYSSYKQENKGIEMTSSSEEDDFIPQNEELKESWLQINKLLDKKRLQETERHLLQNDDSDDANASSISAYTDNSNITYKSNDTRFEERYARDDNSSRSNLANTPRLGKDEPFTENGSVRDIQLDEGYQNESSDNIYSEEKEDSQAEEEYLSESSLKTPREEKKRSIIQKNVPAIDSSGSKNSISPIEKGKLRSQYIKNLSKNIRDHLNSSSTLKPPPQTSSFLLEERKKSLQLSNRSQASHQGDSTYTMKPSLEKTRTDFAKEMISNAYKQHLQSNKRLLGQAESDIRKRRSRAHRASKVIN